MPAALSAWSFPRAGRIDSLAHMYEQSNVCMGNPFQEPRVLYGTYHQVWVCELFHRNPRDRPKYSSLTVPVLVLGDSVSPLEKLSISVLKRVEILPLGEKY